VDDDQRRADGIMHRHADLEDQRRHDQKAPADA
jgi:hypothetical protein